MSDEGKYGILAPQKDITLPHSSSQAALHLHGYRARDLADGDMLGHLLHFHFLASTSHVKRQLGNFTWLLSIEGSILSDGTWYLVNFEALVSRNRSKSKYAKLSEVLHQY